jgi:hypothetical protein
MPLIEQVKELLKGIDQVETEPDGWWETSVGAAFGANRLQALIALLEAGEE